jgi:hypothetical protein
MQINWALVGHVVVGTIITGSQAIAVTYPTNMGLVNVCHIITLITMQIGVSLGVWQSGQQAQLLSDGLLLGKKVGKVSEPEAAPHIEVPVKAEAHVEVKAEEASKAV